ncbi:MAG: 30S ribosomal protein S4 [Methanobacteriota archaeon]|jgi:small subunit ribosomal protein S4|nr:30S ribosomal protein S4 [Euryarchaeota archaeon]CAI8163033.1 MAG: 30S ribosomal protein S4 [Euryarchaeota archaeon]|tara:strand:- start:72 stop:734 length:663 start_codon:yes stop_codon:yes gene_type:complete
MGHPKFARPKYDTPPHPWKADRIEEEHAIRNNHGLKNMTEIWKAKSQLRRHRRQAMKLIGRVDTSEGHFAREKEDLLRSLHSKGLIGSDAIIDDILSLSAEDILNRRLQAQVYYKGLACSMKQARQLVTHGQICIGEQKVTVPSYPVSRDEEEHIRYHPRSNLNDENHIIRQTILGVRESAEYGEEEVDPEFNQNEATAVNDAATDAPKAEDTIPEEGGQ